MSSESKGTIKAALEIGGKRILQTLVTVLRCFPFQKIVLVTNGSKKFSLAGGVAILRADQRCCHSDGPTPAFRGEFARVNRLPRYRALAGLSL